MIIAVIVFNLSNWKEECEQEYELNKSTSLPMCGFIASW